MWAPTCNKLSHEGEVDENVIYSRHPGILPPGLYLLDLAKQNYGPPYPFTQAKRFKNFSVLNSRIVMHLCASLLPG